MDIRVWLALMLCLLGVCVVVWCCVPMLRARRQRIAVRSARWETYVDGLPSGAIQVGARLITSTGDELRRSVVGTVVVSEGYLDEVEDLRFQANQQVITLNAGGDAP